MSRIGTRPCKQSPKKYLFTQIDNYEEYKDAQAALRMLNDAEINLLGASNALVRASNDEAYNEVLKARQSVLRTIRYVNSAMQAFRLTEDYREGVHSELVEKYFDQIDFNQDPEESLEDVDLDEEFSLED